MNSKVILYLLGRILYFLGAVFAVPLLLGILFHDAGITAFSVCLVMSVGVGFVLQRWGQKSSLQQQLTNREGILIVVLTWLMAGLFAAVPFVMTNMLEPCSAFFEAMSGLTTTGATALTEIEIWPKSLLFWRIWLHWIGGLGIIVIFIALLPRISGGAAHLFNAESSGFEGEKIKPRLQQTALTLFKIYGCITAIAAVLLLFCGLNLYDAVTHAMSAVATGGFSGYNDSVAHFQSVSVEVVLGIVMVISGVNFALYFNLTQRGPYVLFRDEEFRGYMLLVLILTGIVTASLFWQGSSFGCSLRDAFFQVASFASTTGYVSADYDKWPAIAKICLMLLYFTGACAGSTAGGIKVSRFIVLLKGIKVGATRLLHPGESKPILYNGRKIDNSVFGLVLAFFFLYIGVFIVLSAAVVFTGVGIGASITGVAACLSSVGPGFGPIVGATGNFSSMPSAAKLLLAFAMLLGRLEMYTVLILFSRKFWNGRSRW